MEKEYMTSAWELTDIDCFRINNSYKEYRELLSELPNWNLNYFIKSAKLHDEKVGDKDKPRKWFLIGSYFYYKVLDNRKYADYYHLVMGTYCFLNSVRSSEGYYNIDLSTLSCARLILFWGLFYDKEPLKEELISISESMYPDSKSDDRMRYINTKIQIQNALAYKFKSRYNGVYIDYREYLPEDDLEYMDNMFRHIDILFDSSYDARKEIIEGGQEYLDRLWRIIKEKAISLIEQ